MRTVRGRPEHAAARAVGRATTAGAAAAVGGPRALVRPQGDGAPGGGRRGEYQGYMSAQDI